MSLNNLKSDIKILEEENDNLIRELEQIKEENGVKDLILSLEEKIKTMTEQEIKWRQTAQTYLDEMNKLRQLKKRGRPRKIQQ